MITIYFNMDYHSKRDTYKLQLVINAPANLKLIQSIYQV